MMAKFYICPFCNSQVSITSETERMDVLGFLHGYHNADDNRPIWSNIFRVYMRHCPSCDEVSFEAEDVYKV